MTLFHGSFSLRLIAIDVFLKEYKRALSEWRPIKPPFD